MVNEKHIGVEAHSGVTGKEQQQRCVRQVTKCECGFSSNLKLPNSLRMRVELGLFQVRDQQKPGWVEYLGLNSGQTVSGVKLPERRLRKFGKGVCSMHND
ncbi:unnamed protein product [Sphenostylis stenocarpa]|uniref:Uncharacterized protein n=1 Tax=Sphenostylis stenocarpa TaxID=92480 RepID=A0AA86SHB2_9FABA|nr:unnamed protein product [Sphenostylis stenocarpa]